MLVTAVSTADHTLTVTRGYGETAAAAILDKDPLVVIGQAYLEGSASRIHRALIQLQRVTTHKSSKHLLK